MPRSAVEQLANCATFQNIFYFFVFIIFFFLRPVFRSRAQSISSRVSLGSYKAVTLHTKILCRMCLEFLHQLYENRKFGIRNTKRSMRRAMYTGHLLSAKFALDYSVFLKIRECTF